MHNKTVHMVAFILLVVGGLNWLLVGLLDLNLVTWVGTMLGDMGMMVERAIYVLVGLSAIYELLTHKANCRMCGSGSSMPM